MIWKSAKRFSGKVHAQTTISSAMAITLKSHRACAIDFDSQRTGIRGEKARQAEPRAIAQNYFKPKMSGDKALPGVQGVGLEPVLRERGSDGNVG
jgi:hypothetical protein